MEPIVEPAPRSVMVRLPAATEMVVELTDTLDLEGVRGRVRYDLPEGLV